MDYSDVQNISDPMQLDELSLKGDVLTRINIAANTNIYEVTLLRLLADENEQVRFIAVQNPKITKKQLEYVLKREQAYIVLVKIIENQLTDSNMLETIINTDNILLLEAISKKENLSRLIIDRFLNDDNITIKKLIVSNPNLTEQDMLNLINKKNSKNGILDELSTNPNITIKVIRRLNEYKNIFIKIQLAKNPKTPLDILVQLSDSQFIDVRLPLVTNKSTPTSLVRKLLNDRNATIRQLAKERLNRQD